MVSLGLKKLLMISLFILGTFLNTFRMFEQYWTDVEEDDLRLERELMDELEVRINAVFYFFQDHNRGTMLRDLCLDAIRDAMQIDLELREVRRYIVEGFPTIVSKTGRAAPYWNIRESLSENNGLVM